MSAHLAQSQLAEVVALLTLSSTPVNNTLSAHRATSLWGATTGYQPPSECWAPARRRRYSNSALCEGASDRASDRNSDSDSDSDSDSHCLRQIASVRLPPARKCLLTERTCRGKYRWEPYGCRRPTSPRPPTLRRLPTLCPPFLCPPPSPVFDEQAESDDEHRRSWTPGCHGQTDSDDGRVYTPCDFDAFAEMAQARADRSDSLSEEEHVREDAPTDNEWDEADGN